MLSSIKTNDSFKQKWDSCVNEYFLFACSTSDKKNDICKSPKLVDCISKLSDITGANGEYIILECMT